MGVYDENGDKLFLNPENAGRFHSDWCSMMYARLLIARNLLTDDGVIFISIDDHENADLVKICNEIFGESCFVCSAVWRSSDNSNNDAKQFSGDHNYTLIYSKQPLWQPEKYKTKANGNILKIRIMTLRGPGLTAIPSIRPIIGRTSGIRLRLRMEISSNHPKTDGVGRKRPCSKKWKRGKFISTQIRQI